MRGLICGTKYAFYCIAVEADAERERRSYQLVSVLGGCSTFTSSRYAATCRWYWTFIKRSMLRWTVFENSWFLRVGCLRLVEALRWVGSSVHLRDSLSCLEPRKPKLVKGAQKSSSGRIAGSTPIDARIRIIRNFATVRNKRKIAPLNTLVTAPTETTSQT